MIIDISKLKKENKATFYFREEIKIDLEEIDKVITAPVDVDFTIMLMFDEVLVSGKYSANVKYTCVKCLSDYEKEFTGEFETAFLEAADFDEYMEGMGQEHYFNPQEVVKEKIVNDKIDMARLIKECMLVNIEEYPVCGADCSGVSQMEKYDNAGMDPRMAKLAEMFKGLD